MLMGAECCMKSMSALFSKKGIQGMKCAVDRNFAIKNETFLDS
jgi:hypothetical protein